MSTEFQVGDECEAFGVSCVVRDIDNSTPWSVGVELLEGSEKGDMIWFLSDGKYYRWNKEPSLKLVKRAKKKVMMQMYCQTSQVKAIGNSIVCVNPVDYQLPTDAVKIGEPFEVEVDE